MLPEICIKETAVVHSEIKASIKTENSKPTQLPSHGADHSNLRNNSHKQGYKFNYVKSTEEAKTGFPTLPAALKPSVNNSSNVIDSTKPSQTPLQKCTESADSILISGSSFAVKRRRSSRVCKPKPGVKRYCGHKIPNKIMSKYKNKVIYNPLFDLGTRCKTNFLRTNNELLTAKQNDTQNKAEEPLVLTNEKEHSQQQMNSNNKGTFSISKSSQCDETSQDAACTSSDENSNNLGFQNCNEMDSLSFANVGLNRKVSQKEVVNCNDLKLVYAKTSNNAEAENTANIDEISMCIDPEAHSIDVVKESTNKMGPDIGSEYMILEEVRDKGFQAFIHDHDYCAHPENIEHSQEGKDKFNTSSGTNTESSDVNTTQYESTNQINADGAHENFVSSSPQECSRQSERLSCQVKPTNETCKSLHSSVGVNNFLVDNLLKNGSLNVTSCPPAHSSINVNCETKEPNSNNHEQETNNIMPSNYVIASFPGPFPRNPSSETCAPIQMYSPAGGVNGDFPFFNGSPCLPTPILASHLVPLSPIFAYNILPMNNAMCASHPGLTPFPFNGGYLSLSFNCTSQQSVHHSLPESFPSAHSDPSNIHHQPGFHQLVNVNTSAVVPCWTQSMSTYIGSHLPSCEGSSHALGAGSQIQLHSGSYPTANCNSVVSSHPCNSDVCVGNDVVNVTCSKTDDVKIIQKHNKVIK